jgi:4-amino-4-deoxy-L-arabinose transferase-like glycosyltransferase
VRPGFLGIDGTWDGLSRALFLAATILVLITFTDYGITWDEDVHNYYGILVLNYYLSGFTDLRSTHWQDLFNYGGAFDMLAAALNTVSPFDTYETRHLLNGLVGILGLVGVSRLGHALGGARAGFLAALFLALTPNYYGQMFNNPKDVPLAAGMVWALYYLVRLAPELPRPRWSLLLKLGLAIGLALGIRVGGLLLLGYLGLLLGLSGVWRAFTERRASILVGDGARSLFLVLLPVAAIAYAVMLVFWPFAQLDPIHNPLQALANFSHQVFPWKTLFAGEYVPASDLPWAYLPVHVALALPELVLILLASAPVFAVVALRKSGVERATALGYAVVGFAVVFPIAYAIAIKAVLFDGMRHFIFVLPPIAALAAVMMDRALDWLQRLSVRRWAYTALGLYAAAHVGIMAMLHPDEYVYYNAFIGGIGGADGLFKTDYWANSYAEAVGGLEDYLHAEFGNDYMDHDFKVAVCGPPISAAFYFPPNFVFTKDRSRADFFIAFTKDDCQKALPGREVYRVERMGVLLSIVLDHRSYLATASAQAPATVK